MASSRGCAGCCWPASPVSTDEGKQDALNRLAANMLNHRQDRQDIGAEHDAQRTPSAESLPGPVSELREHLAEQITESETLA